jgi:homoserine kinase type II
MGLFTELDLDAARAPCAAFGVDVAAIEPLAAGSVNSNFRITGADGVRYFGRIYEEQGEEGAHAELRLLRELAAAGVPTTRPLDAAGGGVVRIGGKAFALYPWVDGEILCQARVTPAHTFEVGRALAALHAATPRVTPLSAGRFRVEDISTRLDRVILESPEYQDAARGLVPRLAEYRARRDPGLPRGVVHGDLFRDNVLWNGPRIAALIDFESACFGPLAFDVMVTLLAWCYGDAFEPDLVRALLEGYSGVRRLEPRERSALATEGGIACLRFATTRITDFAMRAAPGEAPKRDYRRFLSRLAELEAGVLEPHLAALK